MRQPHLLLVDFSLIAKADVAHGQSRARSPDAIVWTWPLFDGQGASCRRPESIAQHVSPTSSQRCNAF